MTGEDAEKIAEEYYGIKREVREDVFTTIEEAEERSMELGCRGYHAHTEGETTIFMPCQSHSDYTEATGTELKVPTDPRMGEGRDIFDSVGEARARADAIGCEGTHTLKTPDGNVYMPCSSHAIYLRETGQNKHRS